MPSPLPTDPPPQPWHAATAANTAEALSTDQRRGLDPQEAQERLERCGPNELEAANARHWVQVLAEQFKDVMVWVLLAAVLVALVLGEVMDAVVIAAIVVQNAPAEGKTFHTPPVHDAHPAVRIALSSSPLFFGEVRKWLLRRARTGNQATGSALVSR